MTMQIVLARVEHKATLPGRWQAVGAAAVWKSDGTSADVVAATQYVSKAPEEGWTVLVFQHEPEPLKRAKELVLKAYRSRS